MEFLKVMCEVLIYSSTCRDACSRNGIIENLLKFKKMFFFLFHSWIKPVWNTCSAPSKIFQNGLKTHRETPVSKRKKKHDYCCYFLLLFFLVKAKKSTSFFFFVFFPFFSGKNTGHFYHNEKEKKCCFQYTKWK